jgi:WD40 repeat protein
MGVIKKALLSVWRQKGPRRTQTTMDAITKQKRRVSALLFVLAFRFLVPASAITASQTSEEDIHYRTSISNMAFSPDGTLLASTSGWIVAIWRVAQADKVREIRRDPKDASVVGLSFSKNGKFLYGGCSDGKLVEWQVDEGKQLQSLVVKPDPSAPIYAFLVTAVAFSHDKTLFANGSHTGEVNVWEVQSGKHISRLAGSQGEIKSLAFSSSDSLLAVGDSNDVIRVWDLKVAGEPRILRRDPGEDAPGWIYSVGFFPSGKIIASSGFHAGVILWDLSTSKQTSIIGESYDWVQSIDISPDGAYILTGSKNTNDRDPKTHVPRSSRISLWNSRSGIVVKQYPGSIALFSPVGREIAISSYQDVTFQAPK